MADDQQITHCLDLLNEVERECQLRLVLDDIVLTCGLLKDSFIKSRPA